MTRGKQAAETATLLTVLDERDLDDPFGVAGGILFAKYGIRFVNLDEGGDANALPPWRGRFHPQHNLMQQIHRR